MEKLLLVDGHNLLFQMFFGLPPRITGRNGQPIQAVVGFIGGLLKMVRMVAPTHLLVVFDGEEGSDRVLNAPDYKAGRTDYSEVADEENPFSQLPLIMLALSELGAAFYETSGGEEADDIIAGYTRSMPGEMQAVIASSDMDFIQLVSPRVQVLTYRGKSSVWYHPGAVEEKWAVRPEQFADYKALVGDRSDNIRGVPRVGPKTAARLLREYGTAEGILNNLDKIKPAFIQRALEESKERIWQNIALIRLERSFLPPYELQALSVSNMLGDRRTAEVLERVGIR